MKLDVWVHLNTLFEDDQQLLTSMKGLSLVSPTSPRRGLCCHFDLAYSNMHCLGNTIYSHGPIIVHSRNIILDLRIGSHGLNKCLNLE